MFITNSGDMPAQISIKGMPPDVQQLNRICSSLTEFFIIGKPVKQTDGRVIVTIPARSIMTLTSADPGLIADKIQTGMQKTSTK